MCVGDARGHWWGVLIGRSDWPQKGAKSTKGKSDDTSDFAYFVPLCGDGFLCDPFYQRVSGGLGGPASASLDRSCRAAEGAADDADLKRT